LQARGKIRCEVERVLGRARREGEELAAFVRQFENWAGRWAVCRWSGEMQEHEISECPKRRTVEGRMVDERVNGDKRDVW
jgi:hypothetical protein